MKDLELFEKRILPTIQEKDKENFTTGTLQDLIKIVKAMEPTEIEAPVIMGRTFRRTLGPTSDKLKEKDYLKKECDPHWFASLDITERYDPKNPILIVKKKDFNLLKEKSEIEVEKRPYGVIYQSGEVIPFYEFIGVGFIAEKPQRKKSLNLFGMRWEESEMHNRLIYQNYDKPPFAIYVIETMNILKDKLKTYQVQAYEILDEQGKLEKELAPLKQEMKELEERIENVEKPCLNRIFKLGQDLYKDTLDAAFDINLDFSGWCK